MCAIVGLFTPSATNPAELHELAARMQAAHQFRGPDGDGIWCNNHVALGSVRLAIHGNRKLGLQPLQDRWGGHLVFNGEIMEPDAVLRSLGEPPHPGESDGVALEAMLALRGPVGLLGMRAMFAAARYDTKDGTLTLVRDTWGQKPLYLARWRDGWAFASTVTALSVATGPLRMRAAAPLEYLVYKSIGGLHSFFEGIEQIAPSSWVQIMPDGTRHTGRYSPIPDDCSAVATPEQVRSELEAAVLVRAADGFENAVLLSGGADSSIVAASLVRQHLLCVAAGGAIQSRADTRSDAAARRRAAGGGRAVAKRVQLHRSGRQGARGGRRGAVCDLYPARDRSSQRRPVHRLSVEAEARPRSEEVFQGCQARGVGATATPVMPALVAGIHAFLRVTKTWMAGTSPAMTDRLIAPQEFSTCRSV